MKPILLIMFIGAAILPLAAQTIAPDIATNGTVTFHLHAPNARSVVVNGQWPNGHASMNEDTNGVWSVTVGPIEPGIWEYNFQVDGLNMIDPSNPMVKATRSPENSILQIEGNPPLLWDFQNVPHGTVHLHTYFSTTLKRTRNLVVYTPPGYEYPSRAKYPVLYLQHGYGDSEKAWTVQGRANVILDNLIAQGRAKPMIVVMMDGHAMVPVASLGQSYLEQNTKLLEHDLFQDAMPLVEKNYRAKNGSINRAFAGLSMGGGQSLAIGLDHSDAFAWVGGFSSVTPSEGEISRGLKNPSVLNRDLKLLWIADGRNDFLLQRNKDFVALLQQKGIRYEWHLTDGGHEWPLWRNYLVGFASELFR